MIDIQKEEEFYSKDFKFSYSSLNKLLFSPSLFYKDYILKDREIRTDKHLIEGKLIHCLLFEPDNLTEKFSIVPGKTPSDNVRKVMKEATQMLTVGNHLDEYHKEICKVMEYELIGLGLLKKGDVEKQKPQAPLYKKYYPHGTSHFLGIDVHDVGNRYNTFEPGMIFTCEPGIYIPKEGIGIRIENDILITEDEPIDLMGSIPIEIEEIEDLMNK